MNSLFINTLRTLAHDATSESKLQLIKELATTTKERLDAIQLLINNLNTEKREVKVALDHYPRGVACLTELAVAMLRKMDPETFPFRPFDSRRLELFRYHPYLIRLIEQGGDSNRLFTGRVIVKTVEVGPLETLRFFYTTDWLEDVRIETIEVNIPKNDIPEYPLALPMDQVDKIIDEHLKKNDYDYDC
jgi:hypothetical protein